MARRREVHRPRTRRPAPNAQARDPVRVLVATANRGELLARRALPSIAAQSRRPDLAVVVDDSDNDAGAEESERIVEEWRPPGIKTGSLPQPPARGASGAWYSGLDHLLRTRGSTALSEPHSPEEPVPSHELMVEGGGDVERDEREENP